MPSRLCLESTVNCYRREHVDELLDAPAVEVELAEDDVLVEVELLALGVLGELVPREAVLLLVGLVGVERLLQRLDQLRRRLVPEAALALDGLAAV